PTIGMVGLLDSPNDKMTLYFKNTGDLIFLVGKSRPDINSSEYLHKIHGVEYSPAPHFDLDAEMALQRKIAALIKGKLIESAHGVSEGGLFVGLLESCLHRNEGVAVKAADAGTRQYAYWFGEAQSRVVVSVRPDKVEAFKKILGDH